jgi:hypothetical protein
MTESERRREMKRLGLRPQKDPTAEQSQADSPAKNTSTKLGKK